MNDKRKHKRFKLNALEVSCTVKFMWDVKVMDISINGVSLESTKLLNLGNSYEVRLKDKKKSISLKGNVMWSSLIRSREGFCGDVIPIYAVGMQFADISQKKEIEIRNFILENQECECFSALEYGTEVEDAPFAMSLPRQFQPFRHLGSSDEHALRTANVGSYATVATYQLTGHRSATGAGVASCGSGNPLVSSSPTAAASVVRLARLIVPKHITATAGKAVTFYAHAVIASTVEKVPATVTLKVAPIKGVRVGIYLASIKKELDNPTSFHFTSRIVCNKSGTWPLKWTAKITLREDIKTSKDILTGTTQVVCRNARWYDD